MAGGYPFDDELEPNPALTARKAERERRIAAGLPVEPDELVTQAAAFIVRLWRHAWSYAQRHRIR